MRIAVTGYVSAQAGSVASANALFLRGLLDLGFEITFFSKASFVDPRPAVGDHPQFHFVDVDNRRMDQLRASTARLPIVSLLTSLLDSHTYHRLLVQTITRHHQDAPFDLVLWLGEYARGAVPGIPSISFAQGPPGTDARSILAHFDEIAALSGAALAWRWRLLAQFRLSPIGQPPLRFSDRIIVGSRQSRRTLQEIYKVPEEKIHCLPYPIDLEAFQPSAALPSTSAPLRCLWLGRIIPRKRLDILLEGAEAAIRSGLDLHVTIVGGIGFVHGYESLISAFPYQDRLKWIPYLPRTEVPDLLHQQDVLIQPSDEENFGSSVAEAQACGLPVIVGATNGNADYLAAGDLQLADDRPETLTKALNELAARKKDRTLSDVATSRHAAESHFSLSKISADLASLLQSFVRP